MQQVIAALESATDGSPDLDLMIWRAVTGEDWHFWGANRDTIRCARYGEDASGNPVVSLDPFTTSTDAALSLMPSGWWVEMEAKGRHFHVSGEFDAGTADRDLEAHEEIFDGPLALNVPTLPLAVCIAALKARSMFSATTN